jgi:hypothetical protein
VGRDDYVESTSEDFRFTNTNGAISLLVNMSGQWVKCRYVLDSVSGSPPPLVNIAYDIEPMGEFV